MCALASEDVMAMMCLHPPGDHQQVQRKAAIEAAIEAALQLPNCVLYDMRV